MCVAEVGPSRESSKSFSAGDIADEEMQKVFNLGIGMVAVVAAEDAMAAIERIEASGIAAFNIGRVETGPSAIEPV